MQFSTTSSIYVPVAVLRRVDSRLSCFEYRLWRSSIADCTMLLFALYLYCYLCTRGCCRFGAENGTTLNINRACDCLTQDVIGERALLTLPSCQNHRDRFLCSWCGSSDKATDLLLHTNPNRLHTTIYYLTFNVVLFCLNISR